MGVGHLRKLNPNSAWKAEFMPGGEPEFTGNDIAAAMAGLDDTHIAFAYYVYANEHHRLIHLVDLLKSEAQCNDRVKSWSLRDGALDAYIIGALYDVVDAPRCGHCDHNGQINGQTCWNCGGYTVLRLSIDQKAAAIAHLADGFKRPKIKRCRDFFNEHKERHDFFYHRIMSMRGALSRHIDRNLGVDM